MSDAASNESSVATTHFVSGTWCGVDDRTATIQDQADTSEEQPHEPARQRANWEGTKPCSRLIDWHTCIPDGDESSMRRVLQTVGQAFNGNAFLGVDHDSGIEVFSSLPADFREAKPSAVVASAVLEASQATAGCLFATDSGRSSGVLKNLRDASQACLVLGFGAGPPARRLGVVVCIPPSNSQSSPLMSKKDYAERIGRVQSELHVWIKVWLDCRAGLRAEKWSRQIHFYRSRKGQIGLVLAALLLLSLTLPIPYRPQRVCIVEPASRRYLSSPVDGRVVDSQVRPGDIVDAGQLLARLDDDQLRWDLSAAEADYESASKRRDSALATRSGGELRLAQLEQERIAIEIESIELNLNQLEIRSPVEGVVVQGDWYRSEGAPVARVAPGQVAWIQIPGQPANLWGALARWAQKKWNSIEQQSAQSART